MKIGMHASVYQLFPFEGRGETESVPREFSNYCLWLHPCGYFWGKYAICGHQACFFAGLIVTEVGLPTPWIQVQVRISFVIPFCTRAEKLGHVWEEIALGLWEPLESLEYFCLLHNWQNHWASVCQWSTGFARIGCWMTCHPIVPLHTAWQSSPQASSFRLWLGSCIFSGLGALNIRGQLPEISWVHLMRLLKKRERVSSQLRQSRFSLFNSFIL